MPVNKWVVYMVCCKDQTLYTGITRDLRRRISEHNSDKSGAKYTRSRQPVRLVYTESVPSRSEALKREFQIKKMSRAKKRALIKAAMIHPVTITAAKHI